MCAVSRRARYTVRVGPAPKIIFTLGTSTRSEEDFIEILFLYGIANVIDVRSFPKSKIPTFTQSYFVQSASEGKSEILLSRSGVRWPAQRRLRCLCHNG